MLYQKCLLFLQEKIKGSITNRVGNSKFLYFCRMNSTELFSVALGLAYPWHIRSVRLEEVSDNERELHIYLDFARGSKFLSRTGEYTTAYDTEEKRWQHLNFFQHRCYLHARVPRLMDAEGKVYQTEVPWARPGSGFTLLFEAYAMLLIEYEMPVCKVAETLFSDTTPCMEGFRLLDRESIFKGRFERSEASRRR
jgi:hypothetical protein